MYNKQGTYWAAIWLIKIAVFSLSIGLSLFVGGLLELLPALPLQTWVVILYVIIYLFISQQGRGRPGTKELGGVPACSQGAARRVSNPLPQGTAADRRHIYSRCGRSCLLLPRQPSFRWQQIVSRREKKLEWHEVASRKVTAGAEKGFFGVVLMEERDFCPRCCSWEVLFSQSR